MISTAFSGSKAFSSSKAFSGSKASLITFSFLNSAGFGRPGGVGITKLHARREKIR